MKNNLKGSIMVLLAALGFGSYGVWSKLIGQDFGVFSQAWIRSGLVLIILIPLVFYLNQYKPVKKTDWKWILVATIFGVFTQAPLYYAYNNVDIGTATLVFYASYLIFSYFAGYVFFQEKITGIKALSLILAILGLGLVFGLSLAVFAAFALSMSAFNGIASGGEVAFTKKSSDKYSSLQISIYIWLGIFISHLPLAFLAQETIPAFSQSTSWLGMLAFATVGLLATWLVVEGYKYVEASIGGLLGLMEIIFGIILGIIIFGEELTTFTLVGGFLILIAAMLPDITELYNRHQNKISYQK